MRIIADYIIELPIQIKIAYPQFLILILTLLLTEVKKGGMVEYKENKHKKPLILYLLLTFKKEEEVMGMTTDPFEPMGMYTGESKAHYRIVIYFIADTENIPPNEFSSVFHIKGTSPQGLSSEEILPSRSYEEVKQIFQRVEIGTAALVIGPQKKIEEILSLFGSLGSYQNSLLLDEQGEIIRSFQWSYP